MVKVDITNSMVNRLIQIYPDLRFEMDQTLLRVGLNRLMVEKEVDGRKRNIERYKV